MATKEQQQQQKAVSERTGAAGVEKKGKGKQELEETGGKRHHINHIAPKELDSQLHGTAPWVS